MFYCLKYARIRYLCQVLDDVIVPCYLNFNQSSIMFQVLNGNYIFCIPEDSELLLWLFCCGGSHIDDRTLARGLNHGWQ